MGSPSSYCTPPKPEPPCHVPQLPWPWLSRATSAPLGSLLPPPSREGSTHACASGAGRPPSWRGPTMLLDPSWAVWLRPLQHALVPSLISFSLGMPFFFAATATLLAFTVACLRTLSFFLRCSFLCANSMYFLKITLIIVCSCNIILIIFPIFFLAKQVEKLNIDQSPKVRGYGALQ